MWAGLSAIRLYLQGIRAYGPDAEQARWAEFTPVKWGNAGAVGGVILAIWPVAKAVIEARPCADSAGKCLPGVKREAGGINGWQILPDGLSGCRACVSSFPRCGNGLHKPLDSSLRWNDDGWIPAFTGRLRASSAACSQRRSTTARLSSPNALLPCRRVHK